MNKKYSLILDSVYAKGHENVLGTHKTTLEVTREDFLTKRGNCIIGINANKSVLDFKPKLKEAIKSGKKIKVVIRSGKFEDHFFGFGNPKLKLSNPVSMVFRKSEFVSDRTALIKCTKSSLEINRNLIKNLKSLHNEVELSFYLAE